MKHYNSILKVTLVLLAACGGASRNGDVDPFSGESGSNSFHSGGTDSNGLGGSESGTGGTDQGEGSSDAIGVGGDSGHSGNGAGGTGGGSSGTGGSSAGTGGVGGSGGLGGSSAGTGGTGGTDVEPECSDIADCDDELPCTSDACDDGQCVHGPSPAGTACGHAGECDGSGACDVVDCNPGDVRCVGNQMEECNSSRSWEDRSSDSVCDENEVMTCSGGSLVSEGFCPFLCFEGTCGGECNPGDLRCVGQGTEICNQNYEWEFGATCQDESNASSICIDGVCGIDCDNGYEDCDGDSSNGCEPVDTTSSCGGCGIVCSPGVACTNSECVGSNGVQAILHGSSFPTSLAVQDETVLWIESPDAEAEFSRLRVREFGLDRDDTIALPILPNVNNSNGRMVRSGTDKFVIRLGQSFFSYDDSDGSLDPLFEDTNRDFGLNWEADSSHVYWMESIPGGSAFWKYTFGDSSPVKVGDYRTLSPGSSYQVAGSFMVLSVDDASGQGYQFVNTVSGLHSFNARQTTGPGGLQKCLNTNLVAGNAEWVFSGDCKINVASRDQSTFDFAGTVNSNLVDLNATSTYSLSGSSIRRVNIVTGVATPAAATSGNPNIVRVSSSHVYWMDTAKIWRAAK